MYFLPSIRMMLGLLGAFCIAGVIHGEEMARIEGGSYIRPLKKDPELRTAATFLLDRQQVTNRQFLAFVRENPKWRKSQINRLFADEGYLRHWESDLVLGAMAPPDAPVTNVSWFAARAFLKKKTSDCPPPMNGSSPLGQMPPSSMRFPIRPSRTPSSLGIPGLLQRSTRQ